MQEKANNMATVAKTHEKKKTKKKSIISRENQNKILRAYISLYNAFLLKNLLAGKTLGAASHNAIQMLKAKIASMDKRNPVTRLLRRIHAYHKTVIYKRIMTSKFCNSCAIIRPEERAKITARASQLFNLGNTVLNTMSVQYKPKPKAVAKKQQFVAAQMKIVPNRTKTTQNNQPNHTLALQVFCIQRQRAA